MVVDPLTVKLPGIVTVVLLPPKLIAVLDVVPILIVVAEGAIGNVAALVVIPFVLFTANAFVDIVNPAKVGESPVSNPKSIVDPATPFVVNNAWPCPGDDNTDADTIPLGTEVNDEYGILVNPLPLPKCEPLNEPDAPVIVI